MASGSVSGLASRSRDEARSGGGHGEVDRREQRAVARPAQGSRQLEVGAGRGIDLEACAARAPRRRREGGPGLELGALDIGERKRRGGDLGGSEGAEAVERFDPVELADPPLGRRRVPAVARERRRGNAHIGDDLRKQPLVADRLRRDDLARLQARDLRGKPRFVRFAQREGAGRQIEGRKAVRVASLALPDLLNGDEEARAPWLQEPLLGDRAGRHQPHHIAPDDRLCASLFRLRRVLELLADSDPMAERDQPVEVVVGALDRHAAHADVFALMLAAPGENDSERPACYFCVVEEQLVEIPHPIEQQAVRIGPLDLEILRHHRREARAGVGMGAVARGVHRLEPSKSAGRPQRHWPRYPRIVGAGAADRLLLSLFLQQPALDEPRGAAVPGGVRAHAQVGPLDGKELAGLRFAQLECDAVFQSG